MFPFFNLDARKSLSENKSGREASFLDFDWGNNGEPAYSSASISSIESFSRYFLSLFLIF